MGKTRCSGSQVQICIDHDFDACWAWSPAVNCPAGSSCSTDTDACFPCKDECVDGTQRCLAFSVYLHEFCSDLNGDGCTEWSPPTYCGLGKPCTAADCN